MENNTVQPAPITQTLFRFVSLRNPQLTNDENSNLRFVEKQNTEGIFEQAVANRNETTSKFAALANAAKEFTALTETELKAINEPLYNLSVWLARNKSTATTQEIVDKCKEVVPVDAEITETLWNNLIYQVVTQKEFYAKEVIMQLLLANHLLVHNATNVKLDKEIATMLLNATVVLPKLLFVEDAVVTPEVKKENAVAAPSVATPFMQKQQAILTAKNNIAALTELSQLVKLIEKESQKNKATALKEYQKEYDALVKPILAAHNTATEEYKKAVLNKEENTNGEPTLELPEFDFVYPTEVNVAVLQQQLPQQAKSALQKLPMVNGIETFAELQLAIGNAIATNNDTISANTEVGQQVISVGGVLLTETNTTYRTAFSYQICPKMVTETTANFDMALDVPDSSWEVSSMVYHLQYANGINNTNGFFNKTRVGNTILLGNLYHSGVVVTPPGSILALQGSILFTNGTTLQFVINGINFTQCFTGQLLGTEVIEEEGDGDNDGDTLPAAAFIPKGFGYKQIGIADYKKVEQTVHSYIEGEVSHIENVMAREYKEKATRNLRRSETSTTRSSESEKEQLTDTNSTSRFELQSEIAKVMQQSKDFSANASVGGGFKVGAAGSINFSAGANYATHNSKEESTRQAVTEAKEITQRALDRLVTKVKEERVEKILEEYEEHNTHGFDNKQGDKHVTGVYRWVDKLMKNRIVNFGKRLMFEFMIPQPAKLHTLGVKDEATITTLVKPEDPRTSASYFAMADYTQVTEATAKYWAGKYNAEIAPMPEAEKYVGTSFELYAKTGYEGGTKNGQIQVPEGYATTKAAVSFSGMPTGNSGSNWAKSMQVIIGNKTFNATSQMFIEMPYQPINRFVENVPVSFSQTARHTTTANIAVCCEATTETIVKWQQETFKLIINAYTNVANAYIKNIDAEKQKAEQIKSDNPNFYRQIENTILRKNCIAYLIDKNTNASKTYGKPMHNGSSSFNSYEVSNTAELDNYTAFAKFLEQAFEWEVISYNLYPFYWAGKQDWLKLYQTDNADPLFRSFLQSGMARVVVTVRPGFEAAIQHYMSTGQLWNGGQVPVIGDPLYLSLVEELKEPTGKPEGKAWITRIPTTLTILQADSIGLKVDKALPSITDDIMDYEDPTQVPTSSNFALTSAKLTNTSVTTEGRVIENIDINNGNLQLTDDGSPRQVVAQISLQAIKTGMGL